MRYWVFTWSFAFLLLCTGLGLNEVLLRYAQHRPSLVSDADLFCMSYSRLPSLERDDVLLLGASRMQTNFNLAIFQQHYPDRIVLQLAQSGLGTAFPVFEDIVTKSSFRGIILVDETEQTLVSLNRGQAGFVEHCHYNFSLDRRINREIATWLQRHFVFINSDSSSLRLWGNLFAQRELPEPFYTETQADRSQLVDFSRAKPTALEALYQQRIAEAKNSAENIDSYQTPAEWLAQPAHWLPLLQQFQARGGRIIFVRMPVPQERWQYEEQAMPLTLYWNQFVTQGHLSALHFTEYLSFDDFDFPDASHLDQRDRAVFTERMLLQLNRYLVSEAVVME